MNTTTVAIRRCCVLMLAAPLFMLRAECAEIRIPLPKDVELTPEMAQELESDFATEKEAFVRFLVEAQRARLAIATDNWETAQAKELARKTALQQFQQKAGNVALIKESRTAIALNPALLQTVTAPRLTGRILEVGPDKKYKDLAAVQPDIQAGDVIELSPGIHEFPEKVLQIKNLVLHGKNVHTTTLRFVRDTQRPCSTRVRFENLTIDCNDNPFIDCRASGSVEIVGCHIFNYNSGAGGAEAIFGENTFLYVCDSVFEGMSGKDAKNRNRSPGNALDVRGACALYLARDSFIDNSEIGRPEFIYVLDDCQKSTVTRLKAQWSQNTLWPAEQASVFARRTDTTNMNNAPLEFAQSAVDFDIIMALANPQLPLPANSIWSPCRKDLSRNLAYWIGLLRHQDANVRKVAAARLTALTGEKVACVIPEVPDERKIPPNWKELLDHDDFAVRVKCLDVLRSNPNAAWPLVRELLTEKNISQQLQDSAADLARDLPVWMNLDSDHSLACEQEFSRMSRWLDDHADKLAWNPVQNRYVVKP